MKKDIFIGVPRVVSKRVFKGYLIGKIFYNYSINVIKGALEKIK